jgi:hypothetical protein
MPIPLSEDVSLRSTASVESAATNSILHLCEGLASLSDCSISLRVDAVGARNSQSSIIQGSVNARVISYINFE